MPFDMLPRALPDEGDGVEGLNDEGLMASAEACYKAWKGHFETDAWRASAAESMRAVSAIYFHWAGQASATLSTPRPTCSLTSW